MSRSVIINCFRRFSTSRAAAIRSYTAVNEPVHEYLKGSKERAELDAKLEEYDSHVFDVPIVIGGEEFRNEHHRYQVRPYDHKNILAKFHYADSKLLAKAIKASEAAHRDWSRRSLEERADIFLRAADLVSGKYRMDLMAATMLGQGKTIIQAEIDTACELADFYRFNVQWGLELLDFDCINTDVSTNRWEMRPLEGFWAAIAPFNFTAISGHLAGAPAFMGNVVLWKPSDTALLSSWIVFKLLREAGVPDGVINFVPADGPTFGQAVTSSPALAGINFTGSQATFEHLWQEVAKNIHNYRSFPRLIGECGGKNFHFIHSSAKDVNHIVNSTVRSAFEYGGQKCSACSRMYVPESKWGEIKQKLVQETQKVKLGPANKPDSFFSAVIDEKAFNRIKGYLDHANKNLSVLAGGGCDDSTGYYVEPTVVETKDPRDRIMQEEIFGPVVTVYVYPDNEYKDVLKLVDSTSKYALTGAVFAEDPEVIKVASDELRYATGNFYINDRSTGSVVSQQPFGGARKSGTNDKAGGPHYLTRFVSPQSIKETHEPTEQWDYRYMQH